MYSNLCIVHWYPSPYELQNGVVNLNDDEKSQTSEGSGMEVDSEEDLPFEEFDSEKVKLLQSKTVTRQESSDESSDEEHSSDSEEEKDEEEDATTQYWGPVTSTRPNPTIETIKHMFDMKSADSVHLTTDDGTEHIYDLTVSTGVASLMDRFSSPKSLKGCKWHLRHRGTLFSSASKEGSSFAPGFNVEPAAEYEIDSDEESSEDDFQVAKNKSRSGGSDLDDSDESGEDQRDSDNESTDNSRNDDDVVQSKVKMMPSKKSAKQSKNNAGKGKKMNH